MPHHLSHSLTHNYCHPHSILHLSLTPHFSKYLSSLLSLSPPLSLNPPLSPFVVCLYISLSNAPLSLSPSPLPLSLSPPPTHSPSLPSLPLSLYGLIMLSPISLLASLLHTLPFSHPPPSLSLSLPVTCDYLGLSHP
jgi:hypothetical protein